MPVRIARPRRRGERVTPLASGAVFTVAEREQLRATLVAAARADPRISGAALTGSAAADREDRWSDIDLALAVAADPDRVVADWTARMYAEAGAVDHLDLFRAGTRFRVFLLSSTLQVDIAFWPQATFGAIGPAFRLLFGTAREPGALPASSPAERIGLGWLYALHARSSIARGRAWQAEYMLSALRDEVLALTCLRHGVPAGQARGIDDLPVGATVPEGLVRSLDGAELRRAFAVLAAALLAEAEVVDAELAARLRDPLRELSAPHQVRGVGRGPRHRGVRRPRRPG